MFVAFLIKNDSSNFFIRLENTLPREYVILNIYTLYWCKMCMNCDVHRVNLFNVSNTSYIICMCIYRMCQDHQKLTPYAY